jgi:hypothetical protein
VTIKRALGSLRDRHFARHGRAPEPGPTSVAALFSIAIIGACGGAPKQVGGENDFTQPSAAEAPAPAAEGAAAAAGKTSGAGEAASSRLNAAQREQMEIALRRGGEKSAKCVDVVPEAPRGEGEVKVLFDGQKGRATDATVGPPFAGTPVEACIKRAFVGEIIVPFEGDALEVPYTVKLPPKQGADDGKKPKKK